MVELVKLTTKVRLRRGCRFDSCYPYQPARVNKNQTARTDGKGRKKQKMEKNEKKVTEQNKAFIAETTENGNFVITREAIKGANGQQLKTQDGRLYFAYVLHGKLRNRPVKVDFSPKDKGGYLPLDLVFDVSPKAELYITEVTQEINGTKNKRTVYTVNTVDENGQVWKAEIKPTRTSDRDMLTMLINLIGAQVHTETVDETATA